jgi:hypothetical protein
MAERGQLYILVAWIAVTLFATLFLRPLLDFLGGGRTVIDARSVRWLRVLVFGAFLIGVCYLWKLS